MELYKKNKQTKKTTQLESQKRFPPGSDILNDIQRMKRSN